jgi:hypothetical protein
VALESVKFTFQGLAGSGFQESNQLTFQVLDLAGQPAAAGISVIFTHAALGTSYIGARTNCTVTAATQTTCTAAASTDATGKASITLQSGQIAGLASVVAVAVAGATQASTVATVPFVGAKPSAAHISLDCTPKNVPALSSVNADCTRSTYAGAGITCTATFLDRYDNAVAAPVTANFVAEAGTIAGPVTTAQFDPTKPVQAGLGVATTALTVLGGKLPTGVGDDPTADPLFPGEASATFTDACGTDRVHNPRDGLVSVLVWTRGEEGDCANGVFVDMGEPFVDANDNGHYDVGETFIDVNGNGRYDGPNATCETDAVIWTETRVLYSGQPAVLQQGGAEVLSRIVAGSIDPSSPAYSWTPEPPAPLPTFPDVVTGSVTASDALSVVVMDQNLNPVAPAATTTVTSGGSGLLALTSDADSGAVDGLGMRFVLQFCDASGGNCASRCTATNSPCRAVPRVSGFEFGRWSRRTVGGACSAPGSDQILATAALGGSQVALTPVTVTCQPCAAGLSACGAACVDLQIDTSNCGACGTACGAGVACSQGVCQGGVATSSYALSLAADRSSIPADGVATTAVTATVTYGGAPAAGRVVTFSATGPGALEATTVTTDVTGKATVTLRSTGASGAVTVTASDVVAGSKSVAVNAPLLGNITVASQQYEVQGVRNSGYQETSAITFQVADALGQPYPAGLRVGFSHASVAGSSISPDFAFTDGSGRVSLSLTSGTAAALVNVSATANAGGAATTGFVKSAFVGALPNGAHLHVDCTPKNIPALVQNDCLSSYYDGPGNNVACTVTVGDIYGNAVGIPVLVSLMTEAGTAGPAMQTAAYTFGPPPNAQADLGTATAFINVTGGRLPKDVGNLSTDPLSDALFPNEPGHVFEDACGPSRAHNPRDGLVSVLVMVRGQQGFVDLNGDGIHQDGEPYLDRGEPFLDLNDDGVHQDDEPYIDANGNGWYDGPGGGYDAHPNQIIWAETRILYSGAADPGAVLFQPPAAPFAVSGTTSGPTAVAFPLLIGDANLNPVSRSQGIDKYGVVWSDSVTATGPVSASLFEPALMSSGSLDNQLGLFFGQVFCALDGVSSCSNACTAANSPCRLVPRIEFFPPSALTRVTVAGTCSGGGGAAPATVTATVDASGVPVSLPLSGTCTP